MVKLRLSQKRPCNVYSVLLGCLIRCEKSKFLKTNILEKAMEAFWFIVHDKPSPSACQTETHLCQGIRHTNEAIIDPPDQPLHLQLNATQWP